MSDSPAIDDHHARPGGKPLVARNEAAPPGLPSRDFLTEVTGLQRSLFALICSLLGNSENAQDVLQETNLVLWEKAHEYDPTRPFKPWAFQFAYNQVLAFRQRQYRDRLVFDDAMLREVRDRAEGVTEHLEQKLKSLDDCVQKLPSRHRDLIHRRYVEGMKIKDIAAATEQSANALAATLFRARRRILRCIQAAMAVEGRA